MSANSKAIIYLKENAKDSQTIRVLGGFSETLVLGRVPVNQMELSIIKMSF
jgi:hypothetical protein